MCLDLSAYCYSSSVKWLHVVVVGAGASLCLVRAAVRREERLAWPLLGLGVSGWVAGELADRI